MLPIALTAEPRVPPSILRIAWQLGEPMRPSRLQVFPISTRRRFQVWEFTPLNDSATRKVIAVDLRDRRIHDWKLCATAFDQVVQDYQLRIGQRRSR